jgi:epidermal growth factor receptor substrate 15
MAESNDPSMSQPKHYRIARQANSIIDPAVLNLSPDEKRAFAYLFTLADTDQLGVITGERAVPFFERTTLNPQVLGEIWQIADTENRGLLTRPGFCIVLRLIGHYQAGREPTTELAFQPGPLPKFDGIQIPGAGPTPASPLQGVAPQGALQPQLSGQPPIRVPPLDPQKVQQYSGLFEKSGAQNGRLDAGTAKAIFEKSGLPNEVLGRIWMLSDREQSGALDQTEFIVAMHLLTSMKTRAMTALPNTLPAGFYQAAARRGAPPPPGSRTVPGVAGNPRQFSGSSVGPARTQSPLARPPTYGTPPTISAQTTGPQWLITPQEKAKYDQFFSTVDTQHKGVVTGEQAVRFFSDSGLPEDTLASVWDLADINSEGQLTRDEFAVAMYLIRQQRMPNAAPLPAFLPPALVPPSMRKQNLQQQTEQTTAPAFDNANNASNLPKSAADDLFGLDEISAPQQPVLQPQSTGQSVSRDPFNPSMPTSPSSPQRFQPPAQPANPHFKPFMPTSAFGASLAHQNTGGSATSSQGPANFQPQQQQQQYRAPPAAGMDDLLGEDETSAVESSKITSDTTELANMSNQIGNLRNQMEQTQAKKATTQADLNATAARKKDLEIRLQQFRAQYEQEVRTVKDLEQQLSASRESTKKMDQELALLEGTYQDLTTQHQTVFQALQADQAENANLKQRISQLNAEVARLKPEVEKARMDARQQKGMVSINKKQLATNEGEVERLQSEKADLERQAAASPPPAEPVVASRDVTSPALSTLSATNPFARMNSGDASRAASPPTTMSGAPTPSAFDQLFGPSFAQPGSRSATPPVTSFGARPAPVTAQNVTGSVSSEGRSTPSMTPPPFGDVPREIPDAGEAPPPLPESRQFTPTELPLRSLSPGLESEAGSTQVMPPASRGGDTGTGTPMEVGTPDVRSQAELTETMPGGFPGLDEPTAASSEPVPGAFPSDHAQPKINAQEVSGPSTNNATPSTAPTTGKDDFDSAFAGFDNTERSTASHDPFASIPGENAKSQPRGFSSEFPPIQNLNVEDESDSDSDDDESAKGFGDDFTAASPAKQIPAIAVPTETNQPTSPVVASGSDVASTRPEFVSNESTVSVPPAAADAQSPPTYEQSDEQVHGGNGQRSTSNQFPPEFGGLLPERENPMLPPAPSGEQPPRSEAEKSLRTPQTSLFPNIGTPASATGTEFHDAYSRPVSSVPDLGTGSSQTQTVAPQASKDEFDEFDDFDDLAEAKEADKSGSDADFGFGNHSRDTSEFNAAFDSPAASMSTTMADSQPGPRHLSESNGFSGFGPSESASGAAAATSPQQGAPHDWDAIFSGLDNSATGNIDTSFGGAPSNDPWETNGTNGARPASPQSATTTTTAKPTVTPAPAPGVAITPGEEHDDPILKRLTGMGYTRGAALDALEKYDYDINKVSASVRRR